jgi:hypothetical protein
MRSSESLRQRVEKVFLAQERDRFTDDQLRGLVNGVLSEIQPELDKFREANRERGRISTRLYLARLELREATLRMQRMQRSRNASGEHWERAHRLLRDLMHAIDPTLHDGDLREDLDHCLRLAQKHRHESIERGLP